jgi:hypothetical protein
MRTPTTTSTWAASLRSLLTARQRHGPAASASLSCRQCRWVPIKTPKKNAPL